MSKLKSMFDFLQRFWFKGDKDVVVPFGSVIQKGTPFAIFPLADLWRREKWPRKLKSIIQKRYDPSDKILKTAVDELINGELIGGEESYGEVILPIVIWHNSRKWDLSHLSPSDEEKIAGLNGVIVLSRMQFHKLDSNILLLRLPEKSPDVCRLLQPMLLKIPVFSIRNFITVSADYAFNSIRKSKHESSDTIISYLYELLLLKNKTAVAFHELIRLIDYIRSHKGAAQLINAELQAIAEVDRITSYLKSCLEKMVIMLGAVYGIPKLSEKKQHAQKISSLKDGLPNRATSQPYCQFLMEGLLAKNFSYLSNLRTGLLHKTGISKLQPHSYLGKNVHESPIFETFGHLHGQYKTNTLLFICTLALLTDELAILDPPTAEEVVSIYSFFDSLAVNHATS